MDVCLRAAKGKQQTLVRQLQPGTVLLIISYITFRDCRVTFFSTTFLEIAVYAQRIRQVKSFRYKN